jgi:voltage-gated potassium channel
VALLAAVTLTGTLGYMLIEGWDAWDAFYMSAITITTVGYREVHDLSFGGQVWTVILLFSWVGAALYVFTLLATMVVE